MRVVLFFESAAGSELKHPNLSDIYDYTLGLLACQDGVFPHLKCYRSVNDHLKRLFPRLVPGFTLSRSSPYHKNDNRFVEQKNDALVRQYVGYARFDTPEQVAVLYADMSVYYNLFQSVLHLIEKTVVSDPTADESPGAPSRP
jgi:hypothetical protein